MKKTIKKAYKPKKKPIRWLVKKLREEEREDVYVKNVYWYEHRHLLLHIFFSLLVAWWLSPIVEYFTDGDMKYSKRL